MWIKISILNSYSVDCSNFGFHLVSIKFTIILLVDPNTLELWEWLKIGFEQHTKKKKVHKVDDEWEKVWTSRMSSFGSSNQMNSRMIWLIVSVWY